MNIYLVDTSSLLSNLEKALSFRPLVIFHTVLRELDGLKNADGELGFKARAAIREIKRLQEEGYCKFEDDIPSKPEELIYFVLARNSVPEGKADVSFVFATLNNPELITVTEDISLGLLINASGGTYVSIGEKKADTLQTLEITEEMFNELNSGIDYLRAKEIGVMPNSYATHNGYAYFIDRAYMPKPITNYNELKLSFQLPIGERILKGTASPRNPEQATLCHLFKYLGAGSSQVGIVNIRGGFGTGKSFLSTYFALQSLTNETKEKIVIITNNSAVANTRDIGALPGTMLEKELPFLGTFVDIIGREALLALIEQEKVEIVPLGFARGRSFTNSIVIANESQNLSEDQVMLLVGRIGKDSLIIFDGDSKQRDMLRGKVGVDLLDKIETDEKLSRFYQRINLKKTERSEIARIADFLSENR